MTKHGYAKNHVFYETKRPGQKLGSIFSKNGTPLERKGRFINLPNPGHSHGKTWKSWNGKHVNKESFVSMRDKAKDSKRLRTSGEALRISGDPQSPPEAAP